VTYELIAGDCLQCKETVDNAMTTDMRSSLSLALTYEPNCNETDGDICQNETACSLVTRKFERSNESLRQYRFGIFVDAEQQKSLLDVG